MHFPRPTLLAFVRGFRCIGIVGFVSASLVACSSSSSSPSSNGTENGTENSTGTATSGSSSSGPAATFTQVYNDVLGPSCGTVCHMPGGVGVQTGLLDMSSKATAYTMLFEVSAMGTPNGCAGKGVRVVPGNVDSSVLAEKVDPKLFPALNCGAIMPLDEPNLPQNQITEIESWIAAGAMNN